MKIVVAPDSFKGSLSAAQVADAITEGILRALPDTEVVQIPIADGGEGTVEALVRATGGTVIPVRAMNPEGIKIESFFGMLGDGDTAIIEMAAASGLPLVREDLRNPMTATSYGTGELIRAALDAGCQEIILGIGGSATNDGGVGAIQALGGHFLDDHRQEVGLGGGELSWIRSIDLSGLDSRLSHTRITVACDVENPLTGENGASSVFGPQKGATPQMVSLLDAGLRNLAEVIRRDLGCDVEHLPGAGAAGGLGAAAVAFLHAELKSGIEIVLEATKFAEHLQDAALVITGEGRIDSQTLQGKTISGVVRLAASANVPVLALGGGVEEDGYQLLRHGAIAVLPIVNKPMSLQNACRDASTLIRNAAEQGVRLFSWKSPY